MHGFLGGLQVFWLLFPKICVIMYIGYLYNNLKEPNYEQFKQRNSKIKAL